MTPAIEPLSVKTALLSGRRPAALLLAGFALAAVAYEAAQAQQPRPATAQAAPQQRSRSSGSNSALGGLGGDSKEPIKIDADKLDVLDKDNKAVFAGNVVAVQGDTTVRCSIMTVFYEGRGGPGGRGGPAAAAPAATPAPAPAVPGQSNDSSIKKIECAGPVTVVSKTQAATSDNAVFDRANNQVIMTGNVALNDGPNITRGDKLVYNTQTGIANVENKKAGGRVQGFFVPNSTEAAKPGAPAAPARAPTN
ncbi:organic solvent tolerance protein OstA [Bosea caraganae]|uniref:Organic solvent tolerance protein OstA n=1 Tax=Bosea caraganae TaxID=2763117 RepID=A0A370L7F7_9HYPH|nr:LptA/OstA family protein [Bosea caraganae]RDJ25004.1 organic solvent tolerance protein OstA [Bosea caraganae]RDJ26114.1 organic solvent tolerance protein OstA [Bosea caraganae]